MAKKAKKEKSHRFLKSFLNHNAVHNVVYIILAVVLFDAAIVLGPMWNFTLLGTVALSLGLILLCTLIYKTIAKKAKELLPKPVYSQGEVQEAKSLELVIKEGRMDADSAKRLERTMKVITMIFVYLFLVVMAIVIIIPFYWMIITSLKSNSEIRDQVTFFPQHIQWANYVVLFKGVPLGGEFEGNVLNTTAISAFDFVTYLRNTLIVGIFSTAGTLITTILAAFAFARLNFKGKETLFSLFLATMMIPGEMLVITNYITVSKLGWLSTDVGVFVAMIVPFWVSVFYIYLLRQNFKQIPNELYYAAKVDGKSDWTYLWKVMVPLASPTLITIFILKLMGAWNSYVWPNLVANKENLRLITNGLRMYSPSPQGEPHQGLQMAATVIVTAPLLLLFIFFRKYIMRGVGRAGIKG